MFLVNSRSPLASAALAPNGPAVSGSGPPFSRSYGGVLPSSFTTVRSCAWACSARPPVSVWGTGGPAPRVEAFLGASGSPCFPGPIGPGHRRASPPPSKAAARICLGGGPRAWTGRAIRPAGPPLRVTPVNTLAYLRGGSPDPRRPAPRRPEDRVGGAYRAARGVGQRPRVGTVGIRSGTGISTRRPSTTPVGLALGPDSPRAD